MQAKVHTTLGVRAHVVPVSAKTTWVLLELTLANGLAGWGEVTDFGNETAILAEVAAIDAALVAAPPASLGEALGLVAGRQVSPAGRIVRNGLEQAFLDAQAQQAGLSMATMLGGNFRGAVPVYANINRGVAATRRSADFAEQARLALADGYRAIKIAPFDGVHWRTTDGIAERVERGVERVLAVREAIGTGIDLMVDCHSRLDPLLTTRVLDAVAPAAPYWLEDVLDPVFGAAEQVALRRHAHRHGTRIAGGEEIGALPELLGFLELGGTDVVLPDLRLTGIRHGMAMCEVAAARGQLISLHNPVGPVLDAVSLQVAAAMPDFLVLERPVRESPLWQGLRGGAPLVADGQSVLPQRPGLGIAIDAATLGTLAAAPTPPRPASFRGLPGAGPDA